MAEEDDGFVLCRTRRLRINQLFPDDIRRSYCRIRKFRIWRHLDFALSVGRFYSALGFKLFDNQGDAALMSALLILFFELHDDVVGLVGGAHFNVGVHEDDVGFAVLMV